MVLEILEFQSCTNSKQKLPIEIFVSVHKNPVSKNYTCISFFLYVSKYGANDREKAANFLFSDRAKIPYFGVFGWIVIVLKFDFKH